MVTRRKRMGGEILLGRQGKETSNELHGRFRPHGRGGMVVAHHKRSRREDDGAQGIWMLITYCLSKAERYLVRRGSVCECDPWMGRMNPCEMGGSGAHAQPPDACLRGTEAGHLEGMHLGGSALAPILPESYVHACYFRQTTNAQESGDQQKAVSAGGYVRHGCLVLEPLLVDSVYLQMTDLQGAGTLSCSGLGGHDRCSGSSPSTLQCSGEMYHWRLRSVLERHFGGQGPVGPKWIRGFWCCSNKFRSRHYEGNESPNQVARIPQLVS